MIDGINEEIRNRILVAVYAYAYELEEHSIVDDFTYDELSRKIKPEVDTGNEVMDKFFRTKFMPDSGMWIRYYPTKEFGKLITLYDRYFSPDRMIERFRKE